MNIRQTLLSLILLFSCLIGRADSIPDDLQIGLITCSPGTRVYELFGHTAIRVQSNRYQADLIYNYGIFSFDTPNFLYRFTKGETDYMLGVYEFQDFILSYAARNSEVTEQELNLTPKEKQLLFEALQINSLPENSVYRYNFLYDNCSTRARDIINQHITGQVEYADPGQTTTFRTMIHQCTRNDRWLTLGIDLALGSPIDRPVTYMQQMFLPEVLMQATARARIEKPDGDISPLVARTVPILEKSPDRLPPATGFSVTPLFCLSGVLLCVVVLTCLEIKHLKMRRWLDSLLFLLYGLVGCVLFFLMFKSTHPATYPNYSAFWVHPFHLLPAIFIWVISAKKMLGYYHFVNFVVLFLFLISWYWIPQQLNVAFIPLILILMVRSASFLWIRKLGIKK